jgi:Holliday junction resolvasome RuvABC endonuclease subunit
MFKLIALDLSTTSTGFAIFENEELRESGTIAPKNKDWKVRVKEIYQVIYHMILTEKYPYNSLQVVTETPLSLQNGDTTIKLAKLHGLILSICFQEGVSLQEIDNQTWKKHIAGARATKFQTQDFLRRVRGIKTETTDESDAVGVGMGWMAEERYKEKMEKYAPVKRTRKSRKAA